jgi:hypothetical protein
MLPTGRSSLHEAHIEPPTQPHIWEPPPEGYTTASELPTNPSNPGIWLINLAVLTAATCLRVDPWNETQG